MRKLLFAVLLILALTGVAFAKEDESQKSDISLFAGVMAPDFKGVNDNGDVVKLSDYLKKGSVVLIFYRGAWCSYCNLHLKNFEQNANEIRDLGAELIAVSVDKPEWSAEIVQKQSLSFDVISNPDAKIIKSYNLFHTVPPALRQRYLDHNLDLKTYSGRDDGVIAVPATFVINREGKIIFSYANEDYKVRTQPEEVIGVLEKLKNSTETEEAIK